MACGFKKHRFAAAAVAFVIAVSVLRPFSAFAQTFTMEEATGRSVQCSEEVMSGPCDIRHVHLRLVADLMCLGMQQILSEQADGSFDFDPSFQFVTSLISEADYAVGNLETIICSDCPLTKDLTYRDDNCHCNGPKIYLDSLKKAGFDVLVMANNHSVDWAYIGLDETKRHVDELGFLNCGTCYTDGRGDRFSMLEKDGILIAVLSYTQFLNRYDEISREEVSNYVNLYSKEAMKRDVLAAKALGAQYIIAYNHWGLENTEEITSNQERMAKEMAEAGCDLIIGSHSHCPQRIELIKTSDGRDVLCVYSLGNFVSSMLRDINKDTAILDLELVFDVDKTSYSEPQLISQKAEYIPCRVYRESEFGYNVIVPTNTAYNGGYHDSIIDACLGRLRNVYKGLREYSILPAPEAG